MLNDRPATVKWKIAPDLGSATASAGHLLIFEALRRTALFADLPGSHDRSQGWTDAQILTGAGPDERGRAVADDGDGRRVVAGGVASPCRDHLKARASHDVVAATRGPTPGERS